MTGLAAVSFRAIGVRTPVFVVKHRPAAMLRVV